MKDAVNPALASSAGRLAMQFLAGLPVQPGSDGAIRVARAFPLAAATHFIEWHELRH
jgi:hypothetical protein